MPPIEILRQTLRRVAARMRLRVFLDRLAASLIVGTAFSVLHIAAARTGVMFRLGVLTPPDWPALAAVGLAALAGVAWGLWVRVSDFEAAHETDLSLGLRERLGSAVALAGARPRRGYLIAALIADAAEHCAEISPRAVVPRVLPRHGVAVPVLASALAALWLAPQVHLLNSPSEVTERQAVAAQGKRLLDIAREVQRKAEASGLERTRQAAERIETLAQGLAAGRTGKRDAMKQIAELTDALRAEHRRIAAEQQVEQLDQTMADAAKAARSSEDVGSLMQSLAEGDVGAASQKLEQLKSKLESGAMSEEQRKSVAQDLHDVAERLAGTRAEKLGSEFRQASEAISEGDMQAAGERLSQAQREMRQVEGLERLSEMQQLAELARELEFSEDQVARRAQGGGESQAAGSGASEPGSAGQAGQGEPGGMQQPTQAEGRSQQTGQSGGDRNEGGGRGQPGTMSGGGTTDADTGEGQDPGAREANPEDPDTFEVRGYEELHEARGQDVQGRSTRVRGTIRDPEKTPTADVRGVAPRADPATPYYSVRPPSRAELEDALDRERIPAGQRPLVQDYFDSLNRR